MSQVLQSTTSTTSEFFSALDIEVPVCDWGDDFYIDDNTTDSEPDSTLAISEKDSDGSSTKANNTDNTTLP